MPPIQISSLSKQFGGHAAVKDLSFDVEAGRVTGFLGPNGAGKTTTLRALLGLVRPSSGSTTFAGQRYDELERPSAHVGAVLEDASFHPGRTARSHLRVLAATGEHPASRIDEVLSVVGLDGARDRHVKGYSLGMRQRLAITAALLGDPPVLILDEPTNGLDPPGIAWVRSFLREQAARGRAVLVSSHVLGGGDGPATEVRAQEPVRLAAALERHGCQVQHDGDVLVVRGAGPEQVGEIASAERVAVIALAPAARSLEAAFFALTGARA